MHWKKNYEEKSGRFFKLCIGYRNLTCNVALDIDFVIVLFYTAGSFISRILFSVWYFHMGRIRNSKFVGKFTLLRQQRHQCLEIETWRVWRLVNFMIKMIILSMTDFSSQRMGTYPKYFRIRNKMQKIKLSLYHNLI